MRRRCSPAWIGIGLALSAAMAPIGSPAAERPEPLPTIVTYELSKARSEAHALARDPKSFWVGEIVARLEDRKPAMPHAGKQPVRAEVRFVVGRDGRVISKEIARSSGDPAIDKEAIAVLARVAPFPPMPAGLRDDRLAFTVPLRFR